MFFNSEKQIQKLKSGFYVLTLTKYGLSFSLIHFITFFEILFA